MSASTDLTRLTLNLDTLVETLNHGAVSHEIEVSVWYSSNDGTWKWSAFPHDYTYTLERKYERKN